MKPFQIAFLTAALSAVLFASQLIRISQQNADGATLKSKIEDHNGWPHIIITSFRSFWNGVTLGAATGGDIFAVAEEDDQEGVDLNAERAALISRHDDAVFYRNASLVVCVGALMLGGFLKRDEAKRNKANKQLP